MGTALGALTQGLPSGLDSWTPDGACRGVGVGDGGADCLSLSQAPRVCGAGADPGGPPPALCAGLQPHSARVEAGLWAAGLVCQP